MSREQRFQALLSRALARFSSDWSRVDALLSTAVPVIVLGEDLPDTERVARAATATAIPQAGRFPTVSFTTRVECLVSEIRCSIRLWDGNNGAAATLITINLVVGGGFALSTPPASFNPFEFPPLNPASGPPNVPAAGPLIFTPQLRPTLAFDAGNALMIASCTTGICPLVGLFDAGRWSAVDLLAAPGFGTILGTAWRFDPPLVLPASMFLVAQWVYPGTMPVLPGLAVTVRYRETR